MRTIAIIDCAVDEPSLACYNRLLEIGIPVSYHSACDFGMSTLINLDNFYGAIVFGSISNVEDEELWHKELGEWVMMALGKGLPVLGICFGHQLICHLFGGDVVLNALYNPSQMGTRKVTFLERFGDILPGEILEFVVSHSYRVTNLPENLAEIGRSSNFPNDIVKHKTLPFVGIQPHPEASNHFIKTEFKNNEVENQSAQIAKVDGIRFIINFIKEFCIEELIASDIYKKKEGAGPPLQDL